MDGGAHLGWGAGLGCVPHFLIVKRARVDSGIGCVELHTMGAEKEGERKRKQFSAEGLRWTARHQVC